MSDTREPEVDILQYSAEVRLHFWTSHPYNSKTTKHYEYGGVKILQKGKRHTSGGRLSVKNDSLPVDVCHSKTTHFRWTCVTQKRLTSGRRVSLKKDFALALY